jgi:hypothetical protein
MLVAPEWSVGIPIFTVHSEAELEELVPSLKLGTGSWRPYSGGYTKPVPADDIEQALVDWNYEWEPCGRHGWPSNKAHRRWLDHGRQLAQQLQERHPEWQVIYGAGDAWEFMRSRSETGERAYD